MRPSGVSWAIPRSRHFRVQFDRLAGEALTAVAMSLLVVAPSHISYARRSWVVPSDDSTVDRTLGNTEALNHLSCSFAVASRSVSNSSVVAIKSILSLDTRDASPRHVPGAPVGLRDPGNDPARSA